METKKKYHERSSDVQNAGWIRRFLAYFIDWYIGFVFTILPIAMMYGMLYGSKDMISSVIVFAKKDASMAMLAGGLAMLFAFFYYVIVPWKLWEGQTVGKRLMKIKIVSNDGEKANLWQLFLRHMIGMLLVEGGIIGATTVLREMIAVGLHTSDWILYARYAAYLISFASGMLVTSTRAKRAIHDYIAKTKVEAVQYE